MSNLPSSDVVCIFCSDIHLSHKAPPFRSSEKNWYDAMARPMNELRQLQKKHDCPIVIAGDIFDKWNVPAELINFAIDVLPKNCYAIPGQHDLPYHNIADIERTAFWTLVKAGKITYLEKPYLIYNELIMLHPFPWGAELQPLSNKAKRITGKAITNIAVVHKYVWMKGFNYPGAPKENTMVLLKQKLRGFNLAVFGDNHKGFAYFIHPNTQFPNIVNCGTFMIRKSDEQDYQPSVWLVKSNDTFNRHLLDTSEDIYDENATPGLDTDPEDMIDFVKGITEFQKMTKDFRAGVLQWMEKHKNLPGSVKAILMDALE